MVDHSNSINTGQFKLVWQITKICFYKYMNSSSTHFGCYASFALVECFLRFSARDPFGVFYNCVENQCICPGAVLSIIAANPPNCCLIMVHPFPLLLLPLQLYLI